MTGFLITFVVVMAVVLLLATTIDFFFVAWDCTVGAVRSIWHGMKYGQSHHGQVPGHPAIPPRRV
jgi:hypothetical protein